MSKLPTIEEIAKDVAHKAMQGITISNMPLSQFIENVNNATENSNCNLTTCRYNKDGVCQNKDKRKECVKVSMSVLCMEKIQNKKNPFEICETNPDCEENPSSCEYAIDCSTLEDAENGERKYICGFNACKYYKER